ncbi:MAG: cytochrome c3 family protein [Gemmatimonadota bacterium]|nr:cytochrome c3 family protein [Gemmatimonadota bacterium]
MRKRWTVLAGGGALTLAIMAFVQGSDQQAAPSDVVYTSDVQPIAFPHSVHAGTFQIDCQYCHFSAERSVDAGIPPVKTCIGCHTLINGRTPSAQAAIQQVREYDQRGESIPWTRIYKISDHAHFPHLRHVNAGVDCTECHGQVQEIGVIEEVNQPLYMGWCVSCHRERDVTTDCTVCHY